MLLPPPAPSHGLLGNKPGNREARLTPVASVHAGLWRSFNTLRAKLIQGFRHVFSDLVSGGSQLDCVKQIHTSPQGMAPHVCLHQATDWFNWRRA